MSGIDVEVVETPIVIEATEILEEIEVIEDGVITTIEVTPAVVDVIPVESHIDVIEVVEEGPQGTPGPEGPPGPSTVIPVSVEPPADPALHDFWVDIS